jgi:hypothetical protein
VSEETKDQTPGDAEPEQDEGVRPPRLAMFVLVLFPFALVVIFGLLYAWIRR